MQAGNTTTFKAAIFDMDGVITQTAVLHAQAWKKMFDHFLEKRNGKNFKPLDIQDDYLTYIDGKPRLKGVKSFLQSRNIVLPEGSPEDDAQQETINGLGTLKNEYFHKILHSEGVQLYQDTLQVLKAWKNRGIKLAVVSSSRNCRLILERAGVLDLFEVRVDGQLVAKDPELKGKPDPDMFLRACKMLGVEPGEAIVIEDAISGVQAGKRGKFKWVVGVARHDDEQALKENGADIVVNKLTELENEMEKISKGRDPETLPHAIEKLNEIGETIGNRKPVLFLDYDGTLSPIVKDPEDAILSEQAKKSITQLAKDYTVAVVSGRDRADVKSKVGLENVIYAGSHGFDITGPNELEMQYKGGVNAIPALDEAEKNLQQKLKDIKGVKVERKKYAIAVHFRNVAEEEVSTVKTAVFEELDKQKQLKKGGGKMILELKPNIDWHKGRATRWLLDALDLKGEQYVPLFIGDDVTDEDALAAIEEDGIGIIVGSHGEPTSAHYKLRDTDEVVQFLDQLQSLLKDKNHGQL